jgi:hypothetical protein
MRFDTRFSDPAAGPTPWEDVEAALGRAELYWLSTVRRDGRPHVTPLVGLWHDGAMHFTTGLEEQKARNLEANAQVAITTGNNTWNEGLDVVVEGTATRVRDGLQAIADAFEAKYGDAWRFEVRSDMFVHGGGEAAVFRIDAAKTLAFAKRPHGQTAFT